jgi:hypothetical protein
VGAQGGSRILDRTLVGVKVALCRGERAVAGDLPKDVHRDTCVSHPGEAGVPQVVPPQVLENPVPSPPHPNASHRAELLC